jgi:hypothetical protein
LKKSVKRIVGIVPVVRTIATSRLMPMRNVTPLPGETQSRSPRLGTSGVWPVVPPHFAATDIAARFPGRCP